MADNFFKKPNQKKPDTYQAEEAAKYANMLRLRAQRLAREAATPPVEHDAAKVKDPQEENP